MPEKPVRLDTSKAFIQEIKAPENKSCDIRLFVKREDLIHPAISGNKWRKLKYNLIEAREQGHDTLLSFGGAFSNHIYALAAAGKTFGFKTIGIIRGDELKGGNSTLSFAKQCGMQLHFIDREQYREKDSPAFLKRITSQFGRFFLIPEGGTNRLALKGVSEMLEDVDMEVDFITVPVGTGGTMAGVLEGQSGKERVIGFPALKNSSFLIEEIEKLTEKKHSNWEIQTDYHFGGYGKIDKTLISFLDNFEKNNLITLDPVYTAKMFYGIFDLIKKGYFPEESRILAIHTGGLQGRKGMQEKMDKIRRQ